MITNISALAFDGPVIVIPGDKLIVNHTVTYDGKLVVKRQLAQHEFDQPTTFTHSIMFKLNGQWNHVIGTQDTIDWLESM